MTIALSLIFGAIIGSFLSVCIYRIPYGRVKGISSLLLDSEIPASDATAGDLPESDPTQEPLPIVQLSIVTPARSLCPCCQKQLLWWHNIPVISWFILGGKCGFCKAGISVRYPLIELLSAALCALSFTRFETSTALVVYIFAASLIVLSFIDIDYYILPNVITYPGTLAGILIAALNHYFSLFSWPIVPDLWLSFYGLLAGGGFLFIISEGYFRLRGKVGLGLGDVKLLAMTGVLLGPEAALVTIFLGSFLGAIIGSLMLLFCKHSMSKPLPFGPYLALGTLLYIFLGPGFPQDLIGTYLYGY